MIDEKNVSTPRVILSLSIGHDASATVLEDGEIRSHVLRERITRKRRIYGMDHDLVKTALAEANVQVKNVDMCVLSGTQMVPLLLEQQNQMNYTPARERDIATWFDGALSTPSSRRELEHLLPEGSAEKDAGKLLLFRVQQNGFSESTLDGQKTAEFLNYLAKHHFMQIENLKDWQVDGYHSPIYGPRIWREGFPMSGLSSAIERVMPLIKAGQYQDYVPIAVTIDSRTIPGVFVNHHTAHAASTYYSSPFERAAIITNDGGRYCESGFVFFADKGQIRPVTPHFLQVGRFYERTAHKCGFDLLSGNGKMMGLSSYGSSLLHGVFPEGNLYDWRQWLEKTHGLTNKDADIGTLCDEMLADALRQARAKGCEIDGFGKKDEILSPITKDIASAAQYMVEETLLAASISVRQGFELAGEKCENLCLSGGVSLNCPANSLISKKAGFDNIHIEPHCDDGGLSIGAAQYVYHSLFRQKFEPVPTRTSEYAMMGMRHEHEIEKALRDYADQICATRCQDVAASIARDLMEDKIIAIYQGKSETGPRALGHRSILANPSNAANLLRVNEVKRREAWRPFAPIVLEHAVHDWFSNGPDRSPFMLFTYKVKPERHKQIPAVTHVDGTSRIQTVAPSDGLIWDAVSQFENLSGIPVVMNTSFNGPGEPIIEHPNEAISMLLNTKIDALYIRGKNDFRVTRPNQTSSAKPAEAVFPK